MSTTPSVSAPDRSNRTLTSPPSSNGRSDGLAPTLERRHRRFALAQLVGLAAVVFSAVYLISDLIEVTQGDFSTFRLSLTYVAEAAIPLFVLGLYAVQRPRIGRLGLFGATLFAYSYVFFTGTVLYALITRTANYHALTTVFGAWMTVHGLIMLIGGLALGLAVVRARVLPGWTGVCLMVGVVLVVVASGLPNVARTLAEAVPATAFTGMGFALLSRRESPPTPVDTACDSPTTHNEPARNDHTPT